MSSLEPWPPCSDGAGGGVAEPQPPEPGLGTLPEAAEWRASQQPEQLAFCWLADGERVAGRLTFGQLDARARTVAAALADRGAAGRPVLVMLEPGLDYIAALLGCLYARAIAAPVYPPDPYRLQRTLPRLEAVVRNAEARWMLTSRAVLGDGRGPVSRLCGGGAVVVEELEEAAAWRGPAPGPQDIALLQYTSGSTGAARGVAIRHANVMHNLRAMYALWDVPQAVGVHWLPPYHDMGLIGGVLLPLYGGRPTVLMSPLAFMQRPVRWLRAIHRFRGTTTGSPNFGYELCARKIREEECGDLDLSCWRVAITGSEPVRSATLDRFAEKFGRWGFRRDAFAPAYGLAEATVVVSGKPHAERLREQWFLGGELQRGKAAPCAAGADGARRLAACGPPAPGVEAVIVDPRTRRRAAVGDVGEIWIRSPGVGIGYHRRPEETNQTFAARLDGDPTGRPYLRTGDLGFLHQGQLYVTGRLKELIILGGRNFTPHEIEQCVQESHPALKADGGAAFSIEREEEERLVVAQEVVRPRRHDLDDLIRRIRKALAESFALTPEAVVLAPAGSLPKTSSGKLRRGECRRLFLENQLSALRVWRRDAEARQGESAPADGRPGGETERRLAAIWRDVLGVDSVRRDDDFFQLGGQSLCVAQLVSRIEDAFGVAPPLQLVFDHPTLGELAAALDQLIGRQRRASAAPLPRARAGGGDADHPLSAAQERFWVLHQLGRQDAFLHVPLAVELAGPLDAGRLEAALNRLIRDHEALRTAFAEGNGCGVQRVLPAAPWSLDRRDLAGSDVPQRLGSLIRQLAAEPFDLSRPPLMRAVLARLGRDRHALVLVLHHLICDGWSLALLLSDLARYYAWDGKARRRPAPLRYVDYARWVREAQSEAWLAERLAYWRRRLADAPTVLELPDDGEPKEAGSESQAIRRRLPPSVQDGLRRLAQAARVTPFLIRLAAYQWLLCRFSGASSVCVGAPVADRRRPEWASLVGCFINTAVLRGDVRGDPAFGDFVQQVRREALADLERADTPLERIVEAVQPERRPDRMPLVQALLLHQDPPELPSRFGDCRVADIRSDYAGLGAFDLALTIERRPGGDELALAFNPGRLSRSMAARMLDGYAAVLETAAADPGVRLSELPVPGPAERRRVLGKWNATARCLPEAASADQMMAAQARRRPEAAAAVWPGGRWTYEQLERRANQLARLLRQRGVACGDRVALLARRSPETLAALLALWKAGAVYVPLDGSYPPPRLRYMVRDCRPSLVLVGTPEARAFGSAELASWKLPVASLDGLLDEAAGLPSTPLEPPPGGGERPAYIMYTSGSTGRPKGVAVPHGALVNLLASFARRPGLAPGDRMLALTPISFDISLLELLLPLATGARVVLSPCGASEDPEAVIRLIAEHEVNVVQATPSTYRVLLLSGWRPATGMKVWCGGEPLTNRLAAELWPPDGELWNVYGPTETTVWSSVERLARPDGPIGVGRPIDNTRMYVLDDDLRPVPIGTPGQLWIAGAGVALGYWDRPAATAERFRPDPFHGRGARMYATGDLARWRSDGCLALLGRRDGQIKVRGARVELGEIEAALCRHEAVAEAAVIPVGRGDGLQLAAHYALRPGAVRPDPEQLRAMLRSQLPEPMIPSWLIEVSALPRTPAGKVDRNALSAPAAAAGRSGLGHDPPRTPIEQQIAAIWRELLRAERVGVHDNFFQLGGHSLIAAQLFARLRQRLGVDLPLRAIYERPTIAELAELALARRLEQIDGFEELLAGLEGLSDEAAARQLNAAGREESDDA